MSIYEWLVLLGVPAIIGAVFKVVFNHIKGVRLGVQALLRAQMISDYNKWSERGYAPIYARQNFQNCWTQYHSLGANGVMDDIYIKFLALPTEPPNRNKKEDDE
jgi:hypothetical protein